MLQLLLFTHFFISVLAAAELAAFLLPGSTTFSTSASIPHRSSKVASHARWLSCYLFWKSSFFVFEQELVFPLFLCCFLSFSFSLSHRSLYLKTKTKNAPRACRAGP